MAVVSRDIFSGDADSDIDGRTPDGGTDALTAVGTWDFVSGTGSTCCIEILPGSGGKVKLGNTGVESHYVMTGLTSVVDEYSVRSTADFTNATDGSWIAVLGNHSNSVTDGYELALIKNSGGYFLELYQFFSGGGSSLLQSNLDPLPITTTENTVELRRIGDTLYGIVNGHSYFSYEVTGAEILTGNYPGICATNGTAGDQGITIKLWEVEVEVALPQPCVSTTEQAIYAQDCFQGATTLGGIEGRVPDGCEADCVAQGSWHNIIMRENVTTPPPTIQSIQIGHQIGDNFTTAVHVGNTQGFWNHESVEQIAALGSDYSVETTGYFTELFATASRHAWFAALARIQTGETDAGLTINFTSGTTSYVVPQGVTRLFVECRQGGAAGGGATGNPAAGGGGAGGTFASGYIDVSPGETLTVIVGATRTGTTGNGGAGNFTAVQRGGTDLIRADGAQGGQAATVNSTNGTGGAANTTGSVGTTIIAGTAGSTGNFTPGASGGQGGAGANGGGAGGTAPADSQAGHNGSAPGGGGSGGKANSATDRAGGNGAAGSARFTGVKEAIGGHGTESCWEWILDNNGLGSLYYVEDGIYFLIDIIRPDVIQAVNEEYRLKLCVQGSQLCCYLNDQLAISRLDTRYPTGLPGMCMMDTTSGTITRVTHWKVVSDESGAPLCNPGGEGGGGTHQNPPLDFDLWAVGKGGWREVPVPIDTATSKVRPWGKGLPRGAKPVAIYSKGAWRSLKDPTVASGGGDEGGSEGDPGDALPDLGCGQVPVVQPPDVQPLPLTSRFIGAYIWPLSDLGPVGNGTRWAVGGWMPGYINQCRATGSVMTGAQGGYGKFLHNGRFERSYFVDLTLSIVQPVLSSLQAGTIDGSFFGYSFIDDFDSARLWPPSGVSDTDMAWIVAALRAGLPGIRLGMRGRPRQFPFNPGVDFFEAQYVSWRGETAREFGLAEYSLGVSWGSFVKLDLNYAHGGNGSSGRRFANNTGLGQSEHNFMCSPQEVQDYLIDMIDAAVSVDQASHFPGTAGYIYDLQIVSQPGWLNAITIVRNYMAGIPPLP